MTFKVGSCFSGVAGFDQGFERAGFETAWFIENDPHCQSVLRRHWPDTPIYGDIREVRGKDLESVHVMCGGWPCQDHSVAGHRKGFGGERSGLFWEFARLIAECRPAWVVAENVAGLLSQPQEFASILRALDELGYVGGWRILDAKYHGVPQRRRRVFFVAGAGGLGRRAAEVLFESPGGAGNSQTRGEAGQGAAGPSATGTHEIGETAHTLKVPSKGTPWRGDGGDNLVPTVSMALNSRGDRYDGESQSFVVQIAHTGRNGIGDSNSVAYTLDQSNGQAIAFDLAQITSAMPHGAKPMVFQQNQRDEVRLIGGDGRTVGSLASQPGMKQQNYIAAPVLSLARRGREGGADLEWRDDDTYNALRSGDGGSSRQSYQGLPGTTGYAVRRLTPRECEALMNWPRDWTRWDADGNELSDATRYRMCGNGVVASVAEWLARRLYAVMDSELKGEKR